MEVVARRIVALLEPLPNVSETGAGAVHVVYTCSPGPFPVHELAKYLGQSQGALLDKLPMTEWIALAMQAGINKMVGMYLQEVSSKRMGWYPPVVPGPVN